MILTQISAEARPTLKLALPLIIAFLGQQLIAIVDTFVSGQLGVEVLAAVSLGNALFFLITIFPIGLLKGLDPIIAQALGAQRPQLAWSACRRGIGLALLLSTITALILAISSCEGWPWSPPSTVSDYVSDYLLGRGWCVPLILVHTCLRSFLQAHERGGAILLGTGISNLLNLSLSVYLGGGDRLFYQIFGWELGWGFSGWGALGIGVASSIVLFVEVLFLLGIAWRMDHKSDPEIMSDTPEGATGERSISGSWVTSWRELCHIGIPIGGSMLSEGGVFCISTLIVSAWSTVSIGAHQVVMILCTTSFMICLGVANATCVRVGLAFGAQDRVRARAATCVGLCLSVTVMTCSAFAFTMWSQELAGLLTTDQEVIALCVDLLQIVIIFQLFDGVQTTTAAALRGAGYTRVPLISAFISHWGVGLPLGLYLAFVLKLEVVGLWWGLSGGLISAALILTSSFFWLTRSSLMNNGEGHDVNKP